MSENEKTEPNAPTEVLIVTPRIGNIQAAVSLIDTGMAQRPVVRFARVAPTAPYWEMEEVTALRDLLERVITTAYDIQTSVPEVPEDSE